MNIIESQKHLVQKLDTKLHYRVQVESITRHLFRVELEIDCSEYNELTLSLPSWIPGSYMIRDFAKNIVEIKACARKENAVDLQQVDKQTWKLNCKQNDSITVIYSVYAFDLSVRSAFLDKEFGFANGTSLFLCVDEMQNQAMSVSFKPVEILPNWEIFTAMPQTKLSWQGYGQHQCNNYLELIEHPILWSEPHKIKFEVNEIEFEMVFAGGVDADLHRIKQDLIKVVGHHLKLFGKHLNISRYLFITMLTEDGFGGLEHTHSTALMFDRKSLPTKAQSDDMPDGYRDFLSLCSHEFFHTWHVKRIKPKEFSCPDLSRETYSEQLWIYEGFTSYYDDYSLLRAGLITSESYLEQLGRQLTRLLRNKGAFKQNVAESSFNAWTKFYKQDENATNAIVSYYNKGAIIALCLDLIIRSRSRGTYSLDSVMRFLWKHYGVTNIGTPSNIINHILNDAMGVDCDEFIAQAVYSTEQLPYEDLLAEIGIKVCFRSRSGNQDKGGKASTNTLKRDFAAIYQKIPAGFKIKQVSEAGAAQLCGLAKDDLIIAINGLQLGQLDLMEELGRLEVNSTARLDLFRRGQLIQLHLPVMPAPLDTVYLEVESKDKSKGWLCPGWLAD